MTELRHGLAWDQSPAAYLSPSVPRMVCEDTSRTIQVSSGRSRKPPRGELRQMERIAPSAVLEAQIADVLSRGIDDNEQLAELGRLGTRLVLQRAVEDEVAAFLGRARYERTSAAAGSSSRSALSTRA